MALVILVLVSVFTGLFVFAYADAYVHQDFRLRNCIDSNKQQLHGATLNPIMINKIESECACIHIHNYTNWLEDCAGIDYA